MSGFQILRQVSNDFEKYLRQVAAESFSAKITEPFENIIAKKLQDVRLFTSKLTLLEAKPLAETPEVREKGQLSTMLDYEDTVSCKIIEQKVVKALCQNHVIKNLLMTPNDDMDPGFVDHKEKIIEHIIKYCQKEYELRSLDAVLKQKEDELLEEQRNWDEGVGKLRDIEKVEECKVEMDGLMNERLQSLTGKIDLMRYFVTKFVTSRCDHSYDWSNDPHQRLRALAIARQINDDI